MNAEIDGTPGLYLKKITMQTRHCTEKVKHQRNLVRSSESTWVKLDTKRKYYWVSSELGLELGPRLHAVHSPLMRSALKSLFISLLITHLDILNLQTEWMSSLMTRRYRMRVTKAWGAKGKNMNVRWHGNQKWGFSTTWGWSMQSPKLGPDGPTAGLRFIYGARWYNLLLTFKVPFKSLSH